MTPLMVVHTQWAVVNLNHMWPDRKREWDPGNTHIHIRSETQSLQEHVDGCSHDNSFGLSLLYLAISKSVSQWWETDCVNHTQTNHVSTSECNTNFGGQAHTHTNTHYGSRIKHVRSIVLFFSTVTCFLFEKKHTHQIYWLLFMCNTTNVTYIQDILSVQFVHTKP